MNRNSIIWIVAIGGIGFGAYYYMTSTKQAYAKFIVKEKKHATLADVLTFDKSYLKSWTKAIKAKQDSFKHNGDSYNTQGGMIIK